MRRRTLLQLGIGSAVVLATVGGGLAWLTPGLDPQGRMLGGARAVMHATARAVLDGALPSEASAREMALQAHLQRLDATLAAFPSATRSELSQLLALLAAAPGRLAFAGLRSPWPEAEVAEVQQALQGLRTSSLALRQQAYHALRDLTNAAYFADPSTWQKLGYPGPASI